MHPTLCHSILMEKNLSSKWMHYICHSNPPLYQYQYVTSEHINNAHFASQHIVLVLSRQTERPYTYTPPQLYASPTHVHTNPTWAAPTQHQLPHTLTLICNQSEHTPVINHDIHFLSYHNITIMNMNWAHIIHIGHLSLMHQPYHTSGDTHHRHRLHRLIPISTTTTTNTNIITCTPHTTLATSPDE